MNTQKIIEVFSKMQRVTPRAADKYFRENPEDLDEALSMLAKTPEWEMKQNILAGIAKGISLRKCKICGNLIRYSSPAVYCSRKCKNSDKELFDRIKQTNIEKYGVDNPAKSKEVQDKMKQTNLERYGTENAAQSKIVQDKIKATNIEKYGVEHSFQREDVKEKIQKTFDDKYGGNPNKCREVREKVKHTCLKKYGTEYAVQNKEVVRKAVSTRIANGSTRNQLLSERNWNSEYAKAQREKTMIERYGTTNPTQIPEIKEKIRQTNIKKYGGPAPVFNEAVKNRMRRSRHDLTYERNLVRFKGIVEPMFSKEEFEGADDHSRKYRWKCCKCGNVFEDTCYSHVPRCMKCKPYATNYSFMELDLLEFIKSYFPTAHKDKKLIGPKELDCVIDEIHLAIEFNGKFWHSIERGKGNGYHLNKVIECNKKGYRLLHIWEDEWIDDPGKVRERLREVLTGTEKLDFTDDVIRLDRSWFNGIDIPGYEFVKATKPEIAERHMYDTENCGYLVYKKADRGQ